jgi:hypothetical protein
MPFRSVALAACAAACALQQGDAHASYQLRHGGAAVEAPAAPFLLRQCPAGGTGRAADCPVLAPVGYNGQCPFSTFYATANALPGARRMGNWEDNLLEVYGDAFREAGPPTPNWALNDHDYNTKLGQGNTIGFLKARLKIDPNLLPADVPRVGLLAEKRDRIPAVVRLSDFGATGASPIQRLGRLAVKIPAPQAWFREMNVLFTEALSVFPLADYRALQTFCQDDPSLLSKIAGNARMLWHAGKNFLWDMGLSKLKASQTCEFPAKKFYSQLPYAVGASHSMKLELIPALDTCDTDDAPASDACGCVPAVPAAAVTGPEWAPARAQAIAAFVSKCGFSWELKVRVLPNSDARTQRKANVPWTDVDAIIVGVLRVDKQEAEPESGVGVQLKEALLAQFPGKEGGAPPMTGTHVSKLFRFHPIMTMEEHMPVGEVNHFRSSFYSQHAHARSLTIQKGLAPGREKMPFEKLREFFEGDGGADGGAAAEEPQQASPPEMVGGGLQENSGASGQRKSS